MCEEIEGERVLSMLIVIRVRNESSETTPLAPNLLDRSNTEQGRDKGAEVVRKMEIENKQPGYIVLRLMDLG
jgi:hypothetical protein